MLSVIKAIDDTSRIAPNGVFAMLTTEFGGSGSRNEMLPCELVKLNVQNAADVGTPYRILLMTHLWQRNLSPELLL